MSDTSVTIYLHHPELIEIGQHETGAVFVNLGDYPIRASLLFKDPVAAKNFAQKLFYHAFLLGHHNSLNEMQNEEVTT